jgi:hypothetical protein
MSNGGKLKTGGRGNGGRGNNFERSRSWSQDKKPGVFILQKNANASTTNNWLSAIKDWGNSGELKNDVGELARPHQAGVIRMPQEPIRPDHDDLTDNNEFVYPHREDEGHGDELTERGLRIYKEDFDLYKQEKAVYDAKMREIDQDKYKLHGKLEASLSLDAKTELERTYTAEIWTNKDPVALIEAIKTVFVGQLAGGDSKASRALMKHELDHISRAQGESQLQYSRRFNDAIESYRRAELSAGEIDEDVLDALFNERDLVSRFTTSCGMAAWLWSLRYDAEKEPWPETLAGAIKRANEFEEGMMKKGHNPYVNNNGRSGQNYEAFQAFLVQQSQKKSTKNGQGKQHPQRQQSSQPAGQSKQGETAGRCRSFATTGTCLWTSEHPHGPPCKYTHDTDNHDSQTSNIGAMTTAAVGQVNQQRQVAFGPNPDVGGGGTGVLTIKNKKLGNG